MAFAVKFVGERDAVPALRPVIVNGFMAVTAVGRGLHRRACFGVQRKILLGKNERINPLAEKRRRFFFTGRGECRSGKQQKGEEEARHALFCEHDEAEFVGAANKCLRIHHERLRGFDEGMLLCAGRPSAAALTEVTAAPGIDLYDQDSLTDLLVRQQLGIRRMALPIDYLDAELLGELSDPS